MHIDGSMRYIVILRQRCAWCACEDEWDDGQKYTYTQHRVTSEAQVVINSYSLCRLLFCPRKQVFDQRPDP